MPLTTNPIFFRVPSAIELAEMFDECDRDYAAYLLNTLHHKVLSWSLEHNGYARLKRRYLARFIPERRLTRILTTLKRKGVIRISRSYRVGERSKRYRLEPRYWESKRVECRNSTLVQKIRAYQEKKERRLLPVHRCLRAELGRIAFDHDMAETIITTMEPDKGSPLACPDYHTLLSEMCERFRDKSRLHFTVDKYGRVHTPITNLPKELRPCISITATG